MHRVKFQSISILAIFDCRQAFIVSTEAKLDRHFKVSTDALAVLSYLNYNNNNLSRHFHILHCITYYKCRFVIKTGYMNQNEGRMGYMNPNEGRIGYKNPNGSRAGYMNPNEGRINSEISCVYNS